MVGNTRWKQNYTGRIGIGENQQGVAKLYEGLFTMGSWVKHGLELMGWSVFLFWLRRECLERDFLEEEAADALKVLSGDKASDLKSMMMAFIAEFWDVVKPELMGMMQYFSSLSVYLYLLPFFLEGVASVIIEYLL